MKNKLLFAVLFLTVLLSGCGKNKDDAGWDKNTEESTEDIIATEDRSAEKVTLNMEDYLIDDECGLYSIKSLIGDIDDIVAASMYDAEHVVLLSQDDNSLLTVKLLSLRSGNLVDCCSVKLDEPDDMYGFDDINCYKIISTAPLVVNRSSAGELLIFNEDFTKCTVMEMTNKYNTMSAVCDGNNMYYMNSGDEKIYKYDLSDIAGSSDGEEVDLLYGMPEQGQIESTTMQITYDMGEMVWKPDVNMTWCNIEGIEGNDIYIYAYDIVNGCYFYADYNLNTESYNKMYTVDDYFDVYDGSFEWTVRLCYESEEEFLEDSQVLEYCDYNMGNKYQVILPEGDTESYIWYKIDGMVSEDEQYILSVAVSDDMESEESGIIVSHARDILIWDYDAGPCSSCNGNITSTYAMDEEIEYGEATERAHELEDKYGIQIVLGANVKDQMPDYTPEVCEDTELMMSAMDDIEAAFDIFPEGFIDELTAECFISITIYLTGTLTSKDTTTYIEQAGAVTSTTWNYQMIGVDMNEWNIKETIVHELCHVIDNKLGITDTVNELNEDWSQYNPEGFSYYDSYIGYDFDYDDTYYDDDYYMNLDEELIYFYDDYSKTFPGEDRARLMEHFTEWEYLESCYNSSHIQKKIGVFLEYLYDNFESIKNADSFQWQETYDKLISEGTP